MVKVKICGITNVEDAQLAVKLGASALGFIFYKDSPRYVSPYKVKKIIDALPPFISTVGVFVNQKEGAIRDIARLSGITTIQLHGDETPQVCQRLQPFKIIKAFRVRDDFDFEALRSYRVSAFLFDTYQEDAFGGTGKTFNWDLLKGRSFKCPFILSGGLNPDNVVEAVEKFSPFAVDVSSGVEKVPGKKDYRLLTEYFARLQI